MEGGTGREAAAAVGVAPSIVSLRLNELERLSGAAIIRRPAKPDTLAPIDKDNPRARRGSVRGWHSFRVTWITLALSAGVPMEIVRRVSGHAAVGNVAGFAGSRRGFCRASAQGAARGLCAGASDAPL